MSEDNPRCPKCDHRLSCCICKPDPHPAAVSAPAGEATPLEEAEAYIAALRGPLLYYFGTTDPELLADQWRDGIGPARSPAPASGAPDEEVASHTQSRCIDCKLYLPLFSVDGKTESNRCALCTIIELQSRVAASERAGEAMREIRRMFAVPLGRDVVADLRTFRETMREDAERERGAMREALNWIAAAQLEESFYHGGETYYALSERMRQAARAALTPTSPAPSPEERADGE